ncbi:Nn.00g052450.m01.CDS01 [Neocucurbitaria sp. VM-36]
MKPRPTFPTFVVPGRSILAASNSSCRRNAHFRAIAPALSYHTWHDASRSHVRYGNKAQSVWTRYASASAASAPKSSYGRMPPPPSKTTKTTVPAKHTKTTTVPAKPGASPLTSHSSSTVPAKRPSSAHTTTPTVKARQQLNPPSFTYAPELNVPARKAGQNVASYLWTAGRAYVTFYKTGISHVRQTSKLAKQLRERAAKECPGRDISAALTRAEWQIVLRSRKDVLRLPAFGALVLLLGEWLPLVVLYMTPVIPEACRIPKQVAKDLSKTEKVRHERLRRVSLDAMRLMAQDRRTPGSSTTSANPPNAAAAMVPAAGGSDAKLVKAQDMTLYELLLASARYNCHSRIFDWLYLTPPKSLLRRRVAQRLEYLGKDDALIERDGGWAALGKEEVQRACVERGIDVLGKREDELRRALVVRWKGGRG